VTGSWHGSRGVNRDVPDAGHPVGLTMTKDGVMLMTDEAANTVRRVSAR
jgi:hypothetical protein